MKNTFEKAERLKSTKTIAHLFSSGRSFAAYPLRLVYIATPITDGSKFIPVQFALSVPKKKYKRAVDRNLLRRLIREAYRLRKNTFIEELTQLTTEKPIQYSFMMLYTGKDILSYTEIEKSMDKLLKHFFYDAKLRQ